MRTESTTQALPKSKGPLASGCCLMVKYKQRGSETTLVTPMGSLPAPRSGAGVHGERGDSASTAPGASAETCIQASYSQW